MGLATSCIAPRSTQHLLTPPPGRSRNSKTCGADIFPVINAPHPEATVPIKVAIYLYFVLYFYVSFFLLVMAARITIGSAACRMLHSGSRLLPTPSRTAMATTTDANLDSSITWHAKNAEAFENSLDCHPRKRHHTRRGCSAR